MHEDLLDAFNLYVSRILPKRYHVSNEDQLKKDPFYRGYRDGAATIRNAIMTIENLNEVETKMRDALKEHEERGEYTDTADIYTLEHESGQAWILERFLQWFVKK